MKPPTPPRSDDPRRDRMHRVTRRSTTEWIDASVGSLHMALTSYFALGDFGRGTGTAPVPSVMPAGSSERPDPGSAHARRRRANRNARLAAPHTRSSRPERQCRVFRHHDRFALRATRCWRWQTREALGVRELVAARLLALLRSDFGDDIHGPRLQRRWR